MNFDTVKTFLAKQTAIDWIAHGTVVILVLAYVGFQGWALHLGQRWDPAAFGVGATSLVAACTALLAVKRHYGGKQNAGNT